MNDDPRFSAPHLNRTPPPPRPVELLFDFLVGRDHWRCELIDHGPWGTEAHFSKNGVFFVSRRFDQSVDRNRQPREMAIAWAEQERAAMQRTKKS